MNVLHSNLTASISELKKNPMATVEAAKGEPLVVLNRNKPAFYLLSPEKYEEILDILEDIELAKIVKEREGMPTIRVKLEDL